MIFLRTYHCSYDVHFHVLQCYPHSSEIYRLKLYFFLCSVPFHFILYLLFLSHYFSPCPSLNTNQAHTMKGVSSPRTPSKTPSKSLGRVSTLKVWEITRPNVICHVICCLSHSSLFCVGPVGSDDTTISFFGALVHDVPSNAFPLAHSLPVFLTAPFYLFCIFIVFQQKEQPRHVFFFPRFTGEVIFRHLLHTPFILSTFCFLFVFSAFSPWHFPVADSSTATLAYGSRWEHKFPKLESSSGKWKCDHREGVHGIKTL